VEGVIWRLFFKARFYGRCPSKFQPNSSSTRLVEHVDTWRNTWVNL